MSDAFAHLRGEDRRWARELAEQFRAAGAEEPEEWAASEVEEDIPQLARFLFLRRLWRGARQWKQPPEEWFAEPGPAEDADPAVEEDEDEPTLVPASFDAAGGAGDEDEEPAFLAAQQAVRRILAAGADPGDLQEVARAIFLYTAYEAARTVDDGHDPLAGEGMPGWLLTEVGGDLVLTGRMLVNLHEDLLTTEPDEVEG